ncbi:hypothetical protein [Marinomonas mediterranea]|uniref:Polyketide cyclase/dehydrase n=1 Tax=Marinomonas mediterranea (strain ATCC 700492 / JCM 21426 / NBRC 103028 / MMB-1) TaxID=717774 RepID=F2K2Q3_MARM1|nr:hypothetical protein [Marinomonas mediterranea]ADZ91186.1 hypothetical protein Marme_1937 [Marinomonas mediterranea MMB-1]WCN09161.1 hypothetical protein GV055_09605 [Marinomonas mediterranea]WCN17313.1 hypothetical protein GV053_09755 [Marinomonas mediterranea MMB-1]
MKLYESSTIISATPDVLWRVMSEHFQDENAQLFYIESTLPSLPSMANIKLVSKYGFRRRAIKGHVSLAEPPNKLVLSFTVSLPIFKTKEYWSISIESNNDFSSVITFSSNVNGWLTLRHIRNVSTERQLQIDNFIHTLKNKIEVVSNVQSD